jgi:hypothetical protein
VLMITRIVSPAGHMVRPQRRIPAFIPECTAEITPATEQP